MNYPDFVSIGKILASHGINGEVRVKVLTDFPERFSEKAEVFLFHPRQPMPRKPVTILECRPHQQSLLLRLEGVSTREEARALSGVLLQIRGEECRPLSEGRYYLFQIEGLRVFDVGGAPLGVIEEIRQYPNCDYYVVRGEREYFIPALKKIVLEINLPEKRMIVDLGAIEEN